MHQGPVGKFVPVAAVLWYPSAQGGHSVPSINRIIDIVICTISPCRSRIRTEFRRRAVVQIDKVQENDHENGDNEGSYRSDDKKER